MNILDKKFGIRQGHDEQHVRLAEGKTVDAEAFFTESEKFLAEIAPVVLQEVVPTLAERPAKWNPGGFMVFSLGVHERLGPVRLHVFPKGMPRESSQGPNIHNHAWHLSSRVLFGTYRDTLFDLESADAKLSDNSIDGSLIRRVYETRRGLEGRDVLADTGVTVRAMPVSQREVQSGECHHINATGVYHLTTVPEDALVVTLVLDSLAVSDTTQVLLNESRKQIDRIRKEVSLSDKSLVQTQIIKALTKTGGGT